MTTGGMTRLASRRDKQNGKEEKNLWIKLRSKTSPVGVSKSRPGKKRQKEVSTKRCQEGKNADGVSGAEEEAAKMRRCLREH